MTTHDELIEMASDIEQDRDKYKISVNELKVIAADFSKKNPEWKKVSDNPIGDEKFILEKVRHLHREEDDLIKNIEEYNRLKDQYTNEQYTKKQIPCRFLRCCILKANE